MDSAKPLSMAQDIIRRLVGYCHDPSRCGSMSPSIYDTAWVAMVRKPLAGTVEWLSPEAFQRVLEYQGSDGSWARSGTKTDSILSTAAALLALKKHTSNTAPGSVEVVEFMQRTNRAEVALQALLSDWKPEQCDQVGFEIMVSQHLLLLENEGIFFNFPRRYALMSLRAMKLSKISPKSVETVPSTLLHSLEALAGNIDFGRLKSFRMNGSMLGSPSSTAAYLMHRSPWDAEAETYLRNVDDRSSDNNTKGLVPSAWPTTVFELTWVVSTLLQAGVAKEELGLQNLSAIGSFLEMLLEKQQWLVGFAPAMLADADDTARALLTLAELGRPINVAPMVQAFESESHFKTYAGERNASLSANCNVCLTLLACKDRRVWAEQILKCVGFVCSEVSAGNLRDKWNLSMEYSMMLCCQVLRIFTSHMNELNFETAIYRSPGTTPGKIPIITLHLLARLLLSQGSNGSWGDGHEKTAYAVLALTALESLPWNDDHSLLTTAIQRGKTYLAKKITEWPHGDRIWIEKTTYSSTMLSEGYCVAATLVKNSTYAWSPLSCLEDQQNIKTNKKTPKLIPFFHSLPLFSGMSPKHLELAYTQSCFFLKRLEHNKIEIFPPGDSELYKYQEYIPFTWTAVNVQSCEILSPNILDDMIKLSVLTFQADEYMEKVVEGRSLQELDVVADMIHQVTRRHENPEQKRHSNGGIPTLWISRDEPGNEDSNAASVQSVLSRFFDHVLEHPKVLHAQYQLRDRLRHELKLYFLAHVTQAKDNLLFGQQTPLDNVTQIAFERPGRTYYQWARSTSANSTSCPFAFVYYSCLVAPEGIDMWVGPRRAYLLEEVSRRLATMCRQYNDWGSAARDGRERNLNSVNFPEFNDHRYIVDQSTSGAEEQREAVKSDLMWIAEYERAGLEVAMASLQGELDQGLFKAIRLFVNVTDLYGQIYVQRDLHERRRDGASVD